MLGRTAVGGEAMTDRLPAVMDAKAIQSELGVTRAAAQKIMQHCSVFSPPKNELDKVYVFREDVEAYIKRHTYSKDEVQP
jgi:hypothetical protein